MIGQSPSLDWPIVASALVARAQREGVAPLLRWQGGRMGWLTALPAAPRARLDQHSYNAAANIALLHSELQRILAALAPLAVIVLKGAALAHTLYPDPALRPLHDLDLLVTDEALPDVTRRLAALGYTPLPQRPSGVAFDYCQGFQGGPGAAVVVEVHWRLVAGSADWRSSAPAWFWQHAVPLPTIAALQLDPTATLLHLAAHLMLQHGDGPLRLLWLYDVHLLLTQQADALDWAALIDQAATSEWSGAVVAAVEQAHAHWATPLPSALALLRTQRTARERRFFERQAQGEQTIALTTWQTLQTQTWRERLRLLWSIACPPPHVMRVRYPPRHPWLLPLAYPRRWAMLGWAGLRTLLRLRRRKPPLV